jgi:sialic acid synthase SpsE
VEKFKDEIMAVRTTLQSTFADIEIGDGLPPRLIAEIGLNHNGSFDLAKELIYQAALAGASFVKFQKRSPADLAMAYFLDAPFDKSPALGKTQREVRERLELSLEEYITLREYAESLGLIFFASAFDIPSLEFLRQAGISIIKVASHSITHGPLLEKIANYKMPVICSFGGTTENERDQAFEILKGNPLVILHCVSSYPTPDNLIKLDTINYLKERYEVPIGFSSHEEGIDFSIAATILGASMLERHFTLHRSMVGLDHSISLTPDEFSELAEKIKRLLIGRGISQGLMPEEEIAKYNYHVAVCASKFIASGQAITAEMITCKQPLHDPKKFFSGLEYNAILGKIALTDIQEDTPIERTNLK